MKVRSFNRTNVRLCIVVFLSTFICFFNQTTITPALPSIISDFSIDVSTGQWLISGYSMIMAVMIPINAFIIERYTIKSICIFATGIFTVGSFFAGFGFCFALTLIGRLCQGVAYGVLIPTCSAIMFYLFPKKKRGLVLGFFELLLGFAPMIAPAYSGFIVDNLSWNYVYYSVGIVGIVCFILCCFFLTNIKLTENLGPKLDKLSIVLSTSGFAVLLFGCSKIGTSGITYVSAVSLIMGSVVVFCFFYRQTKITNPMLKMHVFKSKKFTISIILICICYLVYTGTIVLFPFLIQSVLGYSATVSGLAMVPSAIILGAMSPIAGNLFDKHGIRFLAPIGFLLLGMSALCFSGLDLKSSIFLVIVFMCLRNFGASFVFSNINAWGINSLKKEQLAHGNAVSSMFKQISMSFGASICTSIYSYISNNMDGDLSGSVAGMYGITTAFYFEAALCLIALLICVFWVRDN